MMSVIRTGLAALAAAIALVPSPASAVYLNSDGTGQALLYAYYTVQASGSDAFNTLISVVNTQNTPRTIKVRFREGRGSRTVLELNVYLAQGDTWTAALVPSADGTLLITRDRSCTDPAVPAAGVAFSNASYASGDDGWGTGLDRTREGHIEVFEMAELPYPQPTIDPTSADCSTAMRTLSRASATPLAGGLMGSASLVNVNTGLDITYNADALASLGTTPMYSDPGMPGTDFDSPAVDPSSGFIFNNTAYRLAWTNGLDAVRSVLLGRIYENEFILDPGTNSATDWVMTFPLRRFRVPGLPAYNACVNLDPAIYDREGNGGNGVEFPEHPPTPYWACGSDTVFSIRNAVSQGKPSAVLGSRNTLAFPSFIVTAFPTPVSYDSIQTTFANGWMSIDWFDLVTFESLTSLPTSVVTDLRTGVSQQRAVMLNGTPGIGFMVRTFQNGTLACGSQACQGNYSGAFPHRRQRQVDGTVR